MRRVGNCVNKLDRVKATPTYTHTHTDMPGDQLVPPRQPSQPLSQVKSSARPCTRVGGLGMSKRTPCAHARTNAHLNGTHKRKRQQQSQTRSGLGAADWC
jgi:hypothetical protein